MDKVVTTLSLEQTAGLAQRLAVNFRGGEVVELIGDLGAGKTALVKCLASAWGSLDEAASPSFTIENIYRCPNFNVHHFRFLPSGRSRHHVL